MVRKISKKGWTLFASLSGLLLLVIQGLFFGSFEGWKRSDVNLKELGRAVAQVFPVAKADMPHTNPCTDLGGISCDISGCAGCDISDINCDACSQMSTGC